MKDKRTLIASLIVIAGVLLSGCIGDDTQDEPSEETQETMDPTTDPSQGQNQTGDTGNDTSAPSNHPPMAVLKTTATVAFVGENITFNASDSSDPDGDPLNYTWDLGDGNTATEVEVTHRYESVGNFSVNLTVSDEAGLTDSEVLIVTIHEPPVTAISDTFTGTLLVGVPIGCCSQAELENVSYTKFTWTLDSDVTDVVLNLTWANLATTQVPETDVNVTVPDLDLFFEDDAGADKSGDQGATGDPFEVIALGSLSAGTYTITVHHFFGSEVDFTVVAKAQLA